jgi:hypothetical protein
MTFTQDLRRKLEVLEVLQAEQGSTSYVYDKTASPTIPSTAAETPRVAQEITGEAYRELTDFTPWVAEPQPSEEISWRRLAIEIQHDAQLWRDIYKGLSKVRTIMDDWHSTLTYLKNKASINKGGRSKGTSDRGPDPAARESTRRKEMFGIVVIIEKITKELHSILARGGGMSQSTTPITLRRSRRLQERQKKEKPRPGQKPIGV